MQQGPPKSWTMLSVTFPLPSGVSLNTKPSKDGPPFMVVPYKLPSSSMTKLVIGLKPVALSLKLNKVLSAHVPFALGDSSYTVPHTSAPPHVDEWLWPPTCVVPQRLPALSNTRPPKGLRPSSFSPVNRWITFSVKVPFAFLVNSKTVPQPWLQKTLFTPPPPEAVAPKRSSAPSRITNPLELHPSLLPWKLCRIVSFQIPPSVVGESS